MAPTEVLDLAGFRLRAGEARRLELELELPPVDLAGQRYTAQPDLVVAQLDVSRTGSGYSLRLRFETSITGPCMRCLADAGPSLQVDAREVDVPGGGEELESPYVRGDLVDVAAWAHDAFVLAAPDQILCEAGCLGLCPVCAVPLRDVSAEHQHESTPDQRWAKLAELRLE